MVGDGGIAQNEDGDAITLWKACQLDNIVGCSLDECLRAMSVPTEARWQSEILEDLRGDGKVPVNNTLKLLRDQHITRTLEYMLRYGT